MKKMKSLTTSWSDLLLLHHISVYLSMTEILLCNIHIVYAIVNLSLSVLVYASSLILLPSVPSLPLDYSPSSPSVPSSFFSLYSLFCLFSPSSVYLLFTLSTLFTLLSFLTLYLFILSTLSLFSLSLSFFLSDVGFWRVMLLESGPTICLYLFYSLAIKYDKHMNDEDMFPQYLCLISKYCLYFIHYNWKSVQCMLKSFSSYLLIFVSIIL